MTSLQAANTEVARLTLTGQGGTEASYITLRVDPAVTTAETGAYFENTDLTGNVNIYVQDGANKWSSYKKNDLANLPLGIITNRRAVADQHYTITFNVPTSTAGLKLYDMVANPGNPIDITNGGTYEFDVNTTLHPDYVAGSNYVIANRFVINYVPNPSLCFNYNVLEVLDHAGESLVVKQGDTEIANVAALPAAYQLDLNAYTGRLVVTLNGQDYQIDANPAATIVP